MDHIVPEIALIGESHLVQEGMAAAIAATQRYAVGRQNTRAGVAIAGEGIKGTAGGVQQAILAGLAMEAEVAGIGELQGMLLGDPPDQRGIQAIANGVGVVGAIDADRIQCIAVTIEVLADDPGSP